MGDDAAAKVEPKSTRDRANEELDRARLTIARSMRRDARWWYNTAKLHALYGNRESDAACRVTVGMMNKLLADQRETNDRRASNDRPVHISIGVAINRGTAEARQHAIDVTEKLSDAAAQREELELAALEAEADEDGDDDAALDEPTE